MAVFDGSQLAQGKAVASATFLAFDHAFSGGVMVATGKVNGTSHDDVIAAAGPGGGPQIQVFDGSQLAQGKATATASFMAFNPAFTGGVSIGVGHLSGNDANADVAVGAGPGGGPQVVIFNGADLAKGQPVAASTFLAFDAGFTGGVEVGVAHNATTGQDILITVAGPGGGPQVNFFNPTVFVVNNFVPYYSFFAFPFLFTGGLAFGPYFSPFFYSPLYSPFFLPGNFYGGWFADPFLTDSAFFDPTFDPGFFDPGFMDPGLFDPGFMDPGFFDPGFGGFDPGFSDFGGFDFGGFDGGF